ncbi:MAG: DUF6503 family protein [Candidatus Cyclobacteriaceae bacterium M3_2C_046]
MTQQRIKWLKSVVIVWPLILLIHCSNPEDAESIINKTIERHGGSLYQQSEIAFNFRNAHYIINRQGGKYSYQKKFLKEQDSVHDVLDNESFSRTLNGQPLPLSTEDITRYSNSLNGVVYFALLPFKLNDESVNKQLLGTNQIKGEPYYKIKVTFDQQGGGEDHQDEFIYWIHQDHYTMDYLAYSFKEDQPGIRFREAVNQREVNGILLADFINYKTDPDQPLTHLDSLFESERLEKVSEIILEDIRVAPLSP